MVNIFRPESPEWPQHLQRYSIRTTRRSEKRFGRKQVVEGMNYALCIIGSIIGQAVETGSTPVLQVGGWSLNL